jgi:hypothetical protein
MPVFRRVSIARRSARGIAYLFLQRPISVDRGMTERARLPIADITIQFRKRAGRQ